MSTDKENDTKNIDGKFLVDFQAHLERRKHQLADARLEALKKRFKEVSSKQLAKKPKLKKKRKSSKKKKK